MAAKKCWRCGCFQDTVKTLQGSELINSPLHEGGVDSNHGSKPGCGQAGSKKEMVKFLVQKGIDSISVNPDAAKEISDYVVELESDNSEDEVELKIPEENLIPIEELQESEEIQTEEKQD